MIELTGITYGYPGGRKVLDGLDFAFAEGDRLGLVGPNGSGKTTLFHIIMGLLSPSAGEVKIIGRPRAKEEDFREVRENIGLLFQDSNDQLFCPTVAEDVAFGPLNLGMSTHDAMHRVRDTLQLVGLSGFEDRVTYKLSGGEKRLVALATILAMKPRALLLDEPAAGLDEKVAQRITGILNDSGLSLIIISHDRDFLENTTNKLATITSGRVEYIS